MSDDSFQPFGSEMNFEPVLVPDLVTLQNNLYTFGIFIYIKFGHYLAPYLMNPIIGKM